MDLFPHWKNLISFPSYSAHLFILDTFLCSEKTMRVVTEFYELNYVPRRFLVMVICPPNDQ